jgi:hypothetical protein
MGVGSNTVKDKLLELDCPETSVAERTKVWVPAERPAAGMGIVWLDAPEPLVIEVPSSVRLHADTPLAASETLKVTFRLCPHSGQKEPAPPRLTCGGWLSSLPLAFPIVELSPQVESAQKVKSFWPSESGTLQAAPGQAKVSPLRVPSISVMLCPLTGSLALRTSWALPAHQPLVTAPLQFTLPETVAGG